MGYYHYTLTSHGLSFNGMLYFLFDNGAVLEMNLWNENDLGLDLLFPPELDLDSTEGDVEWSCLGVFGGHLQKCETFYRNRDDIVMVCIWEMAERFWWRIIHRVLVGEMIKQDPGMTKMIQQYPETRIDFRWFQSIYGHFGFDTRWKRPPFIFSCWPTPLPKPVTKIVWNFLNAACTGDLGLLKIN